MVGVIVFLLIHALFGQAMLIDITNEKLDAGDKLEFASTMFSKEDFPLSHFIIYDPSITINVVFTRESEKEGSLEVLVFEKESYGRFIGPLPSKETKTIYCCTLDKQEKNECDDKKIGEVIRRPQEQIHDYKVHFLKKNLTGTIDMEIPINTTGTFVVLMVNCHENGVGNVFITKGFVLWKNPFGYLPGDDYMKLLHYGILALLYLLVIILFSILCIKYRHILMKIQCGILGIVAFTLIEESSRYFYLLGINKTGNYNNTALFFVIFLTSVKQTLVFVLVLFVSMGLGIVKWTLGTTRYKIGFLAVFHLFLWFLIHIINEINDDEKNKQVVESWVSLSIIIPAAILTTGFFYWIFLSLIRTMQQLTLRRQVLKLDMYKSFFGVLVICVVLMALVILYWSYSRVAGVIPWQKKWILSAFIDFLFFVVLTSLAFLWRPRLNNTRYGYAEFFTDEDNDGGGDIAVPLETVNVISGSSMTHRKANKERVVENKAHEKYDGDRTKNLEKLKLTPFERDIVEFDLPSDDDDEISIDTQLKKME